MNKIIFIFMFQCFFLFTNSEEFELVKSIAKLKRKTYKENKKTLIRIENKIIRNLSSNELLVLIDTLASNNKEINASTLHDIFKSILLCDIQLFNNAFYQKVLKKYTQFSPDVQVVLFHFLFKRPSEISNKWLPVFFKAHGKALIFLGEKALVNADLNFKILLPELEKNLPNKEIRKAIYKIFINQQAESNISLENYPSLKEFSLQDLNDLGTKAKGEARAIQEIEDLITLAIAFNHPIQKNLLSNILLLKNDKLSLSLAELFFHHKQKLPKTLEKILLESEAYKFRLLGLYKKYKIKYPLLNQLVTQEALAAAEVIRWFHEKFQINLTKQQLIFKGMHRHQNIDDETSFVALFKCTISYPFIKEEFPIAVCVGPFQDLRDTRIIPRPYVGTLFRIWSLLSPEKHVQKIQAYPFNSTAIDIESILAYLEEESSTSENPSVEFGSELFFIYRFQRIIDKIKNKKGSFVKSHQGVQEFTFSATGESTGIYQLNQTNLKRNGNFFVNYSELGRYTTGQYLQGKLNGKISVLEDTTENDSIILQISNNQMNKILLVENKTKTLEINFKNSLLDGLFYSNSIEHDLVSKNYWVNGKREGEQFTTYQNGQNKQTINFKNGRPIGEATVYLKDGTIRSKFKYPKVNDKIIEFERYYPSGKVQFKGKLYITTGLNKMSEYYESGQLKQEMSQRDMSLSGPITTYYEDGQKNITSNYINGKRNGIERHYHQNGNLKTTLSYRMENLEGRCEMYYEDGKLKQFVIFKNNIPDGRAIQYNTRGDVIATGIAKKYEMISGSSFNENNLTLNIFKNSRLITIYQCDKDGQKIKIIGPDEKKIRKELILYIEKGWTSLIKLHLKRYSKKNFEDLGNGQNPLHLTAQRGYWGDETLKLFLKEGFDVNKQDNKGNTVLHYCLIQKNYNIIPDILKKSPDLFLKNKNGVTLAPYIVQHADPSNLIKKGDPIKKDDLGNTLLHYGTQFNKIALVKKCLLAGFDIQQKNKESLTPLTIALHKGHNHIAEYLASQNSTLNIFDASYMGKLELLKQLLKKHPEKLNAKNSLGDTLLHASIKNNQIKTFQFLLNQKSNLSTKNITGHLPISLAISRGHKKILTVLLNKGVVLPETCGDDISTVIYFARLNDLGLIKLADKKGFSFDAIDTDLSNLLHIAIINKNEKMLLFLLQKNTSINGKDKNGQTPLMLAIDQRKPFIKHLLKHNAKTTLKVALLLENYELIAKKLKESKYSENKFTKMINIAISSNKFKVIKLFLQHAKDNKLSYGGSYQLFNIAIQNKDKDIVKQLLQIGSFNFYYQTFNHPTPLWKSISEFEDESFVMMMVKKGFDLNYRSFDKALNDFVKHGYRKVIKYALNDGSFIYTNKIKNELISIAENNSDSEMIKILKKTPSFSSEIFTSYSADKMERHFIDSFSKKKKRFSLPREEEEKIEFGIYKTDTISKKRNGAFKLYSVNGTIISSGNYINSKRDGEIFSIGEPTRWGRDHVVLSNYKEGVLHGIKQKYYDFKRKQLVRKDVYKNGLLHGETICYNPIENKESMTISFKKGKKHGPLKKTSKTGLVFIDIIMKEDAIFSGFILLNYHKEIEEIDLEPQFYSGFSNYRKAFKYIFKEGKLISKDEVTLKADYSNATDAGLFWLASRQLDDGSWPMPNDDKKFKLLNTSLSLLSILGAGHTDRVGRFKKTVKKALKWFVKNQQADGSFSKDNRINGICTMAIAEAAGMGAGGTQMKLITEKAVSFLYAQQNNSGGFNIYGKSTKLTPGSYDNMEATVWCIMGLKSAQVSGINEFKTEKAMYKIRKLFDSIAETKLFQSKTKGYAWKNAGGNFEGGKDGGIHQAMAMLIRQYLGANRYEPWMIAAANQLYTKHPKESNKINYLHCYFSTLVLFQMRGKYWKTWNNNLQKSMGKAQSSQSKDLGSWPIMKDDFYKHGGKIATTALATLTLEVYYRYRSVMGDEDDFE